MTEEEKHEKIIKEAVFRELLKLGVESVEVYFDGGGDDGQIESVRPTPEVDLEIPLGSFSYQNGTMYANGKATPCIETRFMELEEGIEQVCYNLLEETGNDWSNNDGAFGTFTLTVATGHVALDYNQRISSSENTEYEFLYNEEDPKEVPNKGPTYSEEPNLKGYRKVRY